MDSLNNDLSYFKKVPPHDAEAEQAVLGCMFMDKDAVNIAVEKLKSDDFYMPENKVIFEAMQELFSSATPIDIITVKNKLEEKNTFAQIGGLGYLASVATAVGNAVNAKHYISIIEQKSILRKLIKAGGEISQMSYDGVDDVSTILDRAEKNIFDIIQGRNSEEFHHIRDIAVESFENIENIFNSDEKLTGVPTGFVDFDAKTAGLQKSDLILLAARPSMGKTAFALNIVQNAAVKAKVPVAVFSLEMSKEQLFNRMLCSEALIDAQKLRMGNLNDEDWEKIVHAMGTLAEAPIYIDDTPGVSPMDVRSKCRRLKLEKGLGLILID